MKSSPKYISDLKESGDFIESHYVGELKAIGRFNENFQNVNFNKSSYEPVFIDIYGESFLWNMIRKMMRIFLFVGKEEMEVYAANADLNDVRDFLLDIVTYVLDCDVTLNDGETIGFSEEQKLRITLSDAVALDGKSLKLEYPQ